MARSRKIDVWADWCVPGDEQGGADDAPPPSPADAPEPAPKTHLEPLFPPGGVPFTPTSPCPHHCKLCSGAGSFVEFETGDVFQCPDCGGVGSGPIPAGSSFVCMSCHQSGKDGTRALPLDVAPLPPGPTIAEQRASRREAARERARLEAYVKKALRKLG